MSFTDCPACGASLPGPFYIAGQVPVHSTLLMRTRQQALEYPKRNLELASCGRCGFITNPGFDPGLHEYSPECEEGQGASPTFRNWMKQLVRQLIDRYDVHRRTVLEIGCGKGDFLSEMCVVGENHGVGYDPAWVPERLQTGGNRVEFKQRKWAREQGTHGADFIVCRHTLEHIPDVQAFMLELRDAIGDDEETLLFFEVPDTRRVLEEGAFWDIYYEHCSYFDQESLCSLFRQTGFEVLECWLDFDDQYLLLVAKAGPRVSGAEPPVRLERPSQDRLQTNLRCWRQWLDDCRGANKQVMIWGGGSKAVAFLSQLDCSGVIEKVVDINPFKQGCFLPGVGHEVVSPDYLAKQLPDSIVLMNPIYYAEVQRVLDDMGCQARLLNVSASPS